MTDHETDTVTDDSTPEAAPGLESGAEPESIQEVSTPDSNALPFPEGEAQAVDTASVTVGRWTAVVPVLAIGGLVMIILTSVWLGGGLSTRWYARLWMILGPPLATAGYLAWQWPAWHHRHLRYWVDRQGLRIHRGVLWRKQISIPTTRVQHTDVSQGPLERMHDLATLTIHTAGTAGASIPLHGLNHATAMSLRDHLLPNQPHES